MLLPIVALHVAGHGSVHGVRLDPDPLNALVGPDGSGKTLVRMTPADR